MFDFMLPTNWLAFVIALVATQVLGFLWYSDMLFSKAWIKAMGKTAKQLAASADNTVYAYSVIGAAIMILVLVNVLRWAGITETVPAIGVALMLWLGFVATSSAMNTAFEARGWKLWAIDNGYHVVNAVMVSVILTMMG